MMLRYKRKDGTQMEFELGDRPVTIGRSPEADLVILDDKASRLHCGIRLWDGDFYLKDLKSKNGTFVNGQRIDMVKLNPGDRVRVGAMVFAFEVAAGKGTQTVLQEVEHEMARGKGYSTLLREIIDDTDATPPPPAPEPEPPPAPEPTPKSDSEDKTNAMPPTRELPGVAPAKPKTIRVKIRKPKRG